MASCSAELMDRNLAIRQYHINSDVFILRDKLGVFQVDSKDMRGLAEIPEMLCGLGVTCYDVQAVRRVGYPCG